MLSGDWQRERGCCPALHAAVVALEHVLHGGLDLRQLRVSGAAAGVAAKPIAEAASSAAAVWRLLFAVS